MCCMRHEPCTSNPNFTCFIHMPGHFVEIIAGSGIYYSVRHPWQVYLYRSLPLRTTSRIYGWILNKVEIPTPIRGAFYGYFMWRYDCDITEAVRSDPKDYPTLGTFFRRTIRPEFRPTAPTDVVSPADGTVTFYGRIENGLLEQVKGLTYSLDAFLGKDVASSLSKRVSTPSTRGGGDGDKCLYFCTVYLAPGDYHGFHSPSDWAINLRRHFTGHLLGVSDRVLRRYPNVLCTNERVLLSGNWQHGFFSMTAVGATNVGNIRIDFEKDLVTNRKAEPLHAHNDKRYDNLTRAKGQRIGEFNLGSSVVLIFEAGPDFEFYCKQGQKVKYGQALGSVSPPPPHPSSNIPPS